MNYHVATPEIRKLRTNVCKYGGNSNKNVKNENDSKTQHLFYSVPQQWSYIAQESSIHHELMCNLRLFCKIKLNDRRKTHTCFLCDKALLSDYTVKTYLSISALYTCEFQGRSHSRHLFYQISSN
jgi:hypothetical protein